MQIFILDYDKRKNAEYYNNKHVCKIQTEIAQMVSTVCRLNGVRNDLLYNITHQDTSLVRWVGICKSNFKWACKFGLILHDEYNHRYPTNGKYQREKKIFKYGLDKIPNIKEGNLTPFIKAFTCYPDLLELDIVEAYREYYRRDKLSFSKWTNRQTPYWIKEKRRLSNDR